MECIQRSTNADDEIVPKLAKSILQTLKDSRGGYSDNSLPMVYLYRFCNSCLQKDLSVR